MYTEFSRMLVPIDFGAESNAALAAAASLARALDASIHLLHVASDPVLPAAAPELYGIDAVRLQQELVDGANARLEALARTAHGVSVSWEVQFGCPAERIARTAADMGAGLIVMGTHGRGLIGHLLLGSVAERVIRIARCPVMTVRGFGSVGLSAPGDPGAYAAQRPESART